MAGLELAIAAAERFRDMNLEALASVEMLNDAMSGEAAKAAEAAAAQDAAANAAGDAARANAEAAAAASAAANATEGLAGAEGTEAAASRAAASGINDMRDAALEAEAAVSRLQYEMAKATATAETAAVMVRPAMDEWRDSIEEAMAAAELAEFQIDGMDRAVEKSGGDAVIAAGALRDLAAAQAEVAGAATLDADALRLEAEMAADAAGEQSLLTATRLASVGATLALSKAESTLAEVQQFESLTSRELADAAARAGQSASNAAGFWSRWGNVIHWVISGSAELLAVVLPAAIAAGAGAFVLYQGAIEQVGFRLQAMYGATEATAAMINKTTGDVLGLGHAFQTAQNEANPIAYELLGAYLNAARTHMVDLAQAGLQVDQALAELGARMDVDLIRQGGQLNSLLAHMVPDLIEIGQLFGNLGHAVLNLASDMPGLAEVLLKIADGASRVVLWISQLPAPLITTFMVFEEFSRWGGLLVTILGKMGLATSELGGRLFSLERFGGILSNVFKAVPMLAANAVQGLGSLMQAVASDEYAFGRAGTAVKGFGEDLEAGVADIPMWEAALGALAIGGYVFLADKALTARSATQQFTDSLQKAAEQASNLDVVSVIEANITKLATAEDHAAASARSAAKSQQDLGDAIHTGVMPVNQAQVKMAELSAGMQQQRQDAANVLAGARLLSTEYGVNFSGALGLADAAQVKLAKGITGTSEAAQIARQQIANLVAGYKAMGQTGGILSSDMNALAAQTGLADTKVQGLNQAWDQLLSNATGLTSNFAGLKTDIGEISNAITTSGKKFDVFGGAAVSSTQEAAYAMKSFSGVGAQVWQNYDSALQQAEQYTDSLRIAATTGSVGQKEFTQQIAYTAQQLLPYARYSKAAASQLSVLVQEAGGPATSNFRTLKDWIDKNSESSKNFMKQTVAETGAMSDATAVAEDYASTLNSQVATALQSATIASSNLTGAAQKFDNAETQAGGHLTGPVHAAFAGLITSLTKVYGNTKTAESIANSYARQLGLTGGQVRTLDREVSGLVGQLSRLHSPPPIDITTEYTTIGTPGTGKGGILPTPSGHALGTWAAAGGVALVGETGPELVRLPAGSQVTPSWQTAGIMHGGGGGGDATVNITHQSNIRVSGQVLGKVTRTATLTYNRHNPSNNLTLGRGRRS